MESTSDLKSRFARAFKRYSAQDARMRSLKLDMPDVLDSAAVHGVHARSRILSDAEREYRAVRLEYVKRLLNGASSQ